MVNPDQYKLAIWNVYETRLCELDANPTESIFMLVVSALVPLNNWIPDDVTEIHWDATVRIAHLVSTSRRPRRDAEWVAGTIYCPHPGVPVGMQNGLQELFTIHIPASP